MIVLQPGGPQQHQFRRIQLGGHIGQLELYYLLARNRLAELHPLLCILKGVFQGCLTDTACLRSNPNPAGVKP